MTIDNEVLKYIVSLKRDNSFREFVKCLAFKLRESEQQQKYIKDDILLRMEQGKAQAFEELYLLIEGAENALNGLRNEQE